MQDLCRQRWSMTAPSGIGPTSCSYIARWAYCIRPAITTFPYPLLLSAPMRSQQGDS
jgi:hypothetical protein